MLKTYLFEFNDVIREFVKVGSAQFGFQLRSDEVWCLLHYGPLRNLGHGRAGRAFLYSPPMLHGFFGLLKTRTISSQHLPTNRVILFYEKIIKTLKSAKYHNLRLLKSSFITHVD
jgi:hypothetical protein